ncbi:MAG: hypothetical protein AAB393_03860 [Bacteroidota bacterium]
MSPRAGRSHKDEIVATLRDAESIKRFTDVQSLLKNHLVHTREILNGKDFLFAGPSGSLHDALRYVDFAQVDEFFLLRVVGSEADQEMIAGYFE